MSAGLTIITASGDDVTVAQESYPDLTIAYERWLETEEGSHESERTMSHLLDAAQDVLNHLGREEDGVEWIREVELPCA